MLIVNSIGTASFSRRSQTGPTDRLLSLSVLLLRTTRFSTTLKRLAKLVPSGITPIYVSHASLAESVSALMLPQLRNTVMDFEGPLFCMILMIRTRLYMTLIMVCYFELYSRARIEPLAA
jgi:hypothetical protein